MYCIVGSTTNRPKRARNNSLMGQGSLVKLLGRFWSDFESNILVRVYIRSDCIWTDSRDNSSKLSSCFLMRVLWW